MPAPMPKSSRRRAFTLTEMLVILGIIVVIITIALPSFNALSGSRSVEAGTNVASSAVGRARAEAIRRGVTCGALFFVDRDGRTAVAIVALGDASGDPDPYDEYKVFSLAADYQASTGDPLGAVAGEPTMTADRVLALFSDAGSDVYKSYSATRDTSGYANRPIVVKLDRQRDAAGDAIADAGIAGVDPVGVNNDPYQGDSTAATGGFGFPNVSPFTGGGEAGESELVLLTDVPTERLPVGVGVQVIQGQSLEAVSGPAAAVDASGTFIERYTRAGLIAFDRQGRMVQRPYYVSLDSPLARVLGLPEAAVDPDVDPSGANSVANYGGMWGYVFDPTAAPPQVRVPLDSGFGIAVYSADDFESGTGDGTALEWKGSFFSSLDDGDTDGYEDNALNPEYGTDGFVEMTDHDLTVTYPAHAWTNPFPNGDGAYLDRAYEEFFEERWLDANAEVLLVDRFSGTLGSNRADSAE